jgi:Nuclease-related domain
MRSGKAAGWLRGQMRLDLLIWAGGIIGLFPFWLIWAPAPWWAYGPTAGVVLYLDREGRGQFARWRKGARGEEAVARELLPLETSGYRTLHDLDTGRGNIDHVVIGPTGVFVLETKAWRRRVWLGPGGRLMTGNWDAHGSRDQTMRNVMLVRKVLHQAGLNCWVNGLIVLTATDLPRGPMNLRHVSVITKHHLDGVLRSGRRRLDEAEISRASAALAASN